MLCWFNGYEQQQKYYIKTAIVKGEGLSEYVSIILQRTHPLLNRLLVVLTMR